MNGQTALIAKNHNNEKKKSKGKTNFLSGVMVLSLSTVIVKIIGLVYKIPMLRLLGSEGMGYFSSAYEIYAMLCVISTAGLPVAMSVMISKERTGDNSIARSIFKVSMRLFLILGILGTAALILCAHPITVLLKSDKSFFCTLAIAPALLFVCISSAYRGYFQGLGMMLPTAVSQIIEALGKMLLGILFAFFALSAGYRTELVAAFAVLGLTLGSAATALYLAISKKLSDNGIKYVDAIQNNVLGKKLLTIAIPVTASSAVMSIIKFIDMAMILRRLQSIGYSDKEAFSVYGSYTTLVIPLFSLAPAFISSIALPLIPRLGGAIASRDKDAQSKAVKDAMRLAMIIAMPIAVGLSLYSYQILHLIFPNEADAVSVAVPLLCVIAPSIPLSCLVTVNNAVLQSYGKTGVPIVAMLIGAIVKIVLSYILIGSESVNILGAPISTFLCDVAIAAFEFYWINRYISGTLKIGKTIIRPYLSALMAVTISRIVYGLIQTQIGDSVFLTVCSIGIAALLYLPICMIMKTIDVEDIEMLPRLNIKKE